MPPTAVRRPLTVTTWLVLSVICLALSPLLLAFAALVSALSGRPQALILARLLIAYFALEFATLLACGALWLASGAGRRIDSPRFQRLHFALLRWFVHSFAKRWLSLQEIEVAPEPSPEAAQALEDDGPLLFFSRHAGPGDTVVVIDRLLTGFAREPSVVFKESVTIDPCVDLIGHRLPHAILDTADPEGCEARIEDVAAGLGRRGVLLLFPEGGNFTPERRRRAIRRLWRKRRRHEAIQAEQMTKVMPPRPTGALAALRGNPDAAVIFAAHTGLGLAAFPREIWRASPIASTLKTRMWLARVDDRPAESDAQAEWLYDWWRRLDQWIEQTDEETV